MTYTEVNKTNVTSASICMSHLMQYVEIKVAGPSNIVSNGSICTVNGVSIKSIWKLCKTNIAHEELTLQDKFKGKYGNFIYQNPNEVLLEKKNNISVGPPKNQYFSFGGRGQPNLFGL
jgi:hypothetical protein